MHKLLLFVSPFSQALTSIEDLHQSCVICTLLKQFLQRFALKLCDLAYSSMATSDNVVTLCSWWPFPKSKNSEEKLNQMVNRKVRTNSDKTTLKWKMRFILHPVKVSNWTWHLAVGCQWYVQANSSSSRVNASWKHKKYTVRFATPLKVITVWKFYFMIQI